MTWAHCLAFLNLYDWNNNNPHRIVVGFQWSSISFLLLFFFWSSISIKQQSFTLQTDNGFKMQIWSNPSVLHLPLRINQKFHMAHKPCVVWPCHLFSIFLLLTEVVCGSQVCLLLSKANKQVSLVERKVCFISDAGNWGVVGEGRHLSRGRFPPLTT